jgi:hypothetical protein
MESNMQENQQTTKKKTLTVQYDDEYLNTKTMELRQKLDALARANNKAQIEIDGIRKTLELILTEPLMRVRWSHYQLSFRAYLSICEPEELLGAFRSLRSRAYRLDKPNKEIWSQQKLDSIENQLATSLATPLLRSEIDWLAKAIDECGFRYTRDNDLKSELIRSSLLWNVFVFLIVLVVLLFYSDLQVDEQSSWEKIPIFLFGVSGGLLSATIQQRRTRMYRHEMPTAKVQLLFKAVFGAIAAIIVNLFLELRIIDFPFLHDKASQSLRLPLAALYIVAFVSGFSELLFFSALEKISLRRTGIEGVPKDKKPGQ